MENTTSPIRHDSPSKLSHVAFLSYYDGRRDHGEEDSSGRRSEDDDNSRESDSCDSSSNHQEHTCKQVIENLQNDTWSEITHLIVMCKDKIPMQ